MANERIRRQRSTGVTTKTITSTVFVTGQYGSKAEAKAVELTRLMQNLLVYGIWPSAQEAANSGVPQGSFIIVDPKETPETDFLVQVVPARNK